MDKERRVLVGMSGGMDSTATCLMLREQGYEVLGLTMWVWGEEPVAARELARQMGISHVVVDERKAFSDTVVQSFIDEYSQGRTPNPCVACNPLFKFRILQEWADKLGCRWMATGHYVNVEQQGSHCYVVAGEDAKKDQSYFLWRLDEELLQRLLFPLGRLTKEAVRHYLRERGYAAKVAEGESMEVCFIRGDYRDFLREQCPDLDSRIGRGWFVNSAGVKLGEHRGFPYYTIGQRKGLEIALGKPAYVLKINPEKNTVMLGDAEQLKAEYMLVEGLRLTDEAEVLQSATLTEARSAAALKATWPTGALTVRIRYRSKPIACSLQRVDGERWLVHFRGEASAIAPGQSAVFYIGKRVVGGSYIASQRGIGQYISVCSHGCGFQGEKYSAPTDSGGCVQ